MQADEVYKMAKTTITTETWMTGLTINIVVNSMTAHGKEE